MSLQHNVIREAIEILQSVGDMAMVSRVQQELRVRQASNAKRNSSERTQSDVVKVAGITEVTIRNRYKELCEHLEYDYNNPKNSLKQEE